MNRLKLGFVNANHTYVSWSTSELRMRFARPWNCFKPSSKIFLLTVPDRSKGSALSKYIFLITRKVWSAEKWSYDLIFMLFLFCSKGQVVWDSVLCASSLWIGVWLRHFLAKLTLCWTQMRHHCAISQLVLHCLLRLKWHLWSGFRHNDSFLETWI